MDHRVFFLERLRQSPGGIELAGRLKEGARSMLHIGVGFFGSDAHPDPAFSQSGFAEVPAQPLILPPGGRRLDYPSREDSREAGGGECRGEGAQAQADDHMTIPGKLAGSHEGGNQLPGQKTRVARLAGKVSRPRFHAAVGDEDTPPIGEGAFSPHRRDDFPRMHRVEVKLPIKEDAQWRRGILSGFEPDGSRPAQCPARYRMLDHLHESWEYRTSVNTQRRKVKRVVPNTLISSAEIILPQRAKVIEQAELCRKHLSRRDFEILHCVWNRPAPVPSVLAPLGHLCSAP
jgi:hypothetical protein